MKFRYILTSLVASLCLFASCEEEPATYLDEVQVSSSFVALKIDGGSEQITVSAQSSWTLDASQIPNWLTVSPTSGNAGETVVTFAVDKALDGRTVDLTITSAGKNQTVHVMQGLPVISPASCAEVLAGPDSKTYQVTGICTKISNTQYGNWYINDGTGEVYIYGTVDAGGAYNWSKFNIEVGDEVTVSGPKTTYNGTVELVDATFISVNKSLIKVESVDPEDATIPSDGGDFTVTLANKGTGVFVEVPEAAKDWLSLKSVNGNKVTFTAAENTKGPRTVTLTFNTTDGKKTYSTETVLSQLGATGSLELPFTVEEAIEAAKNGISNSVYVKGIVSKLVDSKNPAGEYVPGFDAGYGNGSFWISSDGNYNDNLELDFEAYQVNYFDGEKWTEDNSQIAVGAEVIIYGPLTTYKGTSETQGKGAAYIYSINGVTSEANGLGTLECPFNVAGGIEVAKAAPSSKVYVKGIVSKLVNSKNKAGEYVPGFNADYGNGSFWISEDGSYNDDKSLDFEAYQVNYLGGKKWTEEDPQIAVGDAVVLYGPLTTYSGTSETQGKGAAYVYSLNGKTE